MDGGNARIQNRTEKKRRAIAFDFLHHRRKRVSISCNVTASMIICCWHVVVVVVVVVAIIIIILPILYLSKVVDK